MTEADDRIAFGDGGEDLARCSLWWRQPVAAPGLGPLLGGQEAPIGRIGLLEAQGAAMAMSLLERACTNLAQQGCRLVLAPMDGDTWQPYRVLDGDQVPGQAFWGEPDLAPQWADWLAAAGFRVQARFVSSLCTNLEFRRPRLRLAQGWRLQPVEGLRIDDFLEPIHQLVLEGFRQQPLFRPTSLEAFRRHWQSWRPLLDPRLSLLAFDGPELVGLLLAHADGPGGCRAVVRTLVVRPGRTWAGLGRSLLETCHGLAAAAGYQGVIHALMRDPGASLALSRPYAQVFRRYGLFGRPLEERGAQGSNPAASAPS